MNGVPVIFLYLDMQMWEQATHCMHVPVASRGKAGIFEADSKRVLLQTFRAPVRVYTPLGSRSRQDSLATAPTSIVPW